MKHGILKTKTLVALAVVAWAGCSSSDTDVPRTPPFENGILTGGVGSAGTGGASSAGTGATTATGSGGAGSVSGTGGDGVGDICGMGTASADLAPVNMLIMFDRSGSMNDNDKWPNATAALKSFFQNPGAAGLRVALRFFPHDSPATGCNDDACDAMACSQVLVPIGELATDPAPTDVQEDMLVMAIDNSAPGGGGGGGGGQGTPMYAALDGALQWTTTFKNMHPTETTVLIFVTDGEPNGCDEDFDHIAALASDALAATGVSTYAIGLEGSSTAQMDQLAAAGGTGTGIYIGNSANAEQELLDALNAIRGQTLSCNLLMPKPRDPSVPIDTSKVNLTYTDGTGMTYTLAQVADANACGTSPSWYYDDPAAPMNLILCPAACDIVANDPGATLEILLGCGTCGVDDPDCMSGDPGGPGIPPVLK